MLINTKPKSFSVNPKKKVLEGPRSEILKVLKEAANPNCKKCFGLGHIGYSEDKNTGRRTYIPCQKCVENQVHIK